MNSILLDFFENTVNYKKLKRSRKRRKLSVREVAEQTGIPIATLQRYEDGTTKRVPSEAVIKLSKLYGTDYRCYYAWSTFPLFGSISGILLSLFYGISLETIYNGTLFGALIGITGMFGLERIFKKLKDNKNSEVSNKTIIYNQLTEDQKKEYERYKRTCNGFMDTDNILDDFEKEENDNLLFASYMLHVLRKESKKNSLKLDPNQIETLDLEEIQLKKEQIENEMLEAEIVESK